MPISAAVHPVARRSVKRQSRQSRLAALAEGAIALIALYTLLGAGIGSACGSVLLGMLSGLFTGAFAVGAILLISGAARGAELRVDNRSRQAEAQ